MNQKILTDFDIPLPKFWMQESIASKLSAYDELIANNQRRTALLEESARLLYQEWFVRLRFPGHEHTPLRDGLPKGWEPMKVEDALVLQRGFDLPNQDRAPGEIPVYGSTVISGFHNKAMVSAPGIVTGRSGSLGIVQYVPDDFWPLNTALWVREFKRVTPIFAYFLLQQLDLKQFNGGASVPTLDRKAVHRLSVIAPSRKLLELFDEYVEPNFKMMQKLRLQKERLQTARDLLLPRLMSGEISV